MSPKGTRTQDSCTDVWVEISAATILETLDSEKRTIHAAGSATLNCHYLTACFTTGLGAAGLPRLRERNSEFSDALPTTTWSTPPWHTAVDADEC